MDRRTLAVVGVAVSLCGAVASGPMVLNDQPLYEYACHEGNYSLPNMLAGARAQEAR